MNEQENKTLHEMCNTLNAISVNISETALMTARLVERTTLMEERLGRIQAHQEKQNGSIAKALEKSVANDVHAQSNKHLIIWVASIGGSLLLALTGWFISYSVSVSHALASVGR